MVKKLIEAELREQAGTDSYNRFEDSLLYD